MRRSHSVATAVLFSFLAMGGALLLVACDQLNKPIGHPGGSSSSSSSSSSGSVNTTSGDGGGDLNGEGAPAPAPTITAQPGDIRL